MKYIISQKYSIDISYERVRKSLLRNDPVGVEFRSRNIIRRRIYSAKGPFHIVHIDGHDKLKKWGFAIHGGIDGFSRKILWLKVSTTNNDPLVVANYFLQFLMRYRMAPRESCLSIEARRISIVRICRYFPLDGNQVTYMAHLFVISILKSCGLGFFGTGYGGGSIFSIRWV